MHLEAFIKRWEHAEAKERRHKDLFCSELCSVLGVAPPDVDGNRYVFEREAPWRDETGRQRTGWMDLYREGCFILEAKQGAWKKGDQPKRDWVARASQPPSAPEGRSVAETTQPWPPQKKKKSKAPERNSPGWRYAMDLAFQQAVVYSTTVEPRPPFIIITDIGYCFDIYARFGDTGVYRPYPGLHEHRFYLHELPTNVDLLRAIWTAPQSLDRQPIAEQATQEIGMLLEELAEQLEDKGNTPQTVCRFLMRCVFTMFACSVGLLDERLFVAELEKTWIPKPGSFESGLRRLWKAMDVGEEFPIVGQLLQFNGGLFRDPTVIALSEDQLRLLHRIAKSHWRDVEPAIFGALFQRALSQKPKKKRQKYGSHFTPRAYVERILRPCIEEPLNEKFESARQQAHALVEANDLSGAGRVIDQFHAQLCATQILDPACGTGNFLYVALDMLSKIEDQVLVLRGALEKKGHGTVPMVLGDTVSPKQFVGLEIDERAREIADLVLWIGYLQSHFRRYGGHKNPPLPVLKEYENIKERDALLHRLGGGGLDTAVRSQWPNAEYVVGNPPFLGNKKMRGALGAEYVAALQRAYPNVPKTADLVMYWWENAERLLTEGSIKRFGFITTNSIRQRFNRAVVKSALGRNSLCYAVPDHPWLGDDDGGKNAQVRISMTVVSKGAGQDGKLCQVVYEKRATGGALPAVETTETVCRIHSDLQTGVDTTDAVPLDATQQLAFMGVTPGADGFILEPMDDLVTAPIDGADDADDGPPVVVVRPYISGNDITKTWKSRFIIDFYGLEKDVARRVGPAHFNRLASTVQRKKEANARASYAAKWWLFSETRTGLRDSIQGLDRYIVTCRTSEHRVFFFVQGATLVDSTCVAIALNDSYSLGILSSRLHTIWADRLGGSMGVGNQSRYFHEETFETFPFPVDVDPAVRAQIARCAEDLERFRRARLDGGLGITPNDLYGVLAKLRQGGYADLTAKEQEIFTRGMVETLRSHHDDLDRVVLEAYGLASSATDQEILGEVLRRNAALVQEEARGHVRWLRREYQRQGLVAPPGQELLPWPTEGTKRRKLLLRELAKAKTPLTEVELAGHFFGCSANEVVAVLSNEKEVQSVVVPGQPRMWRVGQSQGELVGAQASYRLVSSSRGRR